tara:strand:+ start:3228 stop:5021 length:1794 start_codon:yes stop_codon:yes gene_type:complete
MVKKFPTISYTSRDFNSIRNDLIEYAKRYYPDTFKDFNESSFGALMIDQVAYIGDIMSFYLDYQANESFFTTANEYDNVVKLARQVGYKMSARAASSGVITMFVLAPANSNGIGPDTKYLPILLAGSQFASTSGAVFSLNQSVDFADPDNEVVVASVDSDNTPTYYAVKAEGTVTSGEFVQEDITVGQFEKFLSAELTTKNITEVVAVTDSEGHSYFEVDNLSQNTIYIPVANKNDDRYTTPSIMVPVIVPRRFVLERERDRTFLQFGYGSDSETSTDSIADPTDVLMDLHGRTHVLEKSFDPTKLLSTDKFGIAPENTVLTVVARRNTATTVNAPTNTLISLVSPKFQFTDRNLLDEDKVSTVIGSLEVTNEAPIIGDSSLPEPDELKARVKAHFASQNRAVTQQDYQSLIYNLPPQFGKIKRCAIFQDPDSYRRNLNVYVLSENTDGTLVQTPETTKENLKAWIGRYKMINDTVDILDGRIVNIGINFEIIAEETIGKFEVLQNCYNTLRSLVSNRVLNMGESFSISRIYKILNAVSGVVDVVDVSLVNKTGGAYSTTPFDINSNLSSDGRQLYVPNDHVLEIKRPGSDIQGVVK